MDSTVRLYPEQEAILSELESNPRALVVAQTGSGKTLVGLRRIQAILDRQTTERRALFLAPTNILVSQHFESFKRLSRFPVHVVKAGSKVLDFSAQGVYLSTGHYASYFSENLVKSLFKVIIFDESHKASSVNSPYKKVLDSLDPTFIYGLTASPGKKNVMKNILKNLKLDHVVYGKRPHSFNVKVSYVQVKNHSVVNQTYNTYVNWLTTSYPSLYHHLKLPKNGVTQHLIKNKLKTMKTIQQLGIPLHQYYRFFHLSYCGYLFYYECYDAFFKYYSKLRQRYSFEKYYHFKRVLNQKIHPKKFQVLLDLLRGQENTSLVFFQNYETALSCKDYLLKNNFKEEELKVIAGKSKISPKVRDEIVKKTHSSEVKVLLSTSVVEEGIDIRGVDRVVFYKPIYNKIRVIQREGRTGRHRDGSVDILYYHNSEEEKIKDVL